jgi:putative ABC transport system permease protein
MIITGAIMAIMFNATFFTWIIERLFGWIGSLAPVLKTAIAYPLNSRFRTGTAMVLFAMIMATVIVMALVIQATQSLIVMDVRQSGGFTIQASNTLLSFFNPLGDMEEQIAGAQADYPLLAQVENVGSVATTEVNVRDAEGTQFDTFTDFAGLSSGYIAQVGNIYGFAQRAEGYADDAAVWEALRTRDDVVVVRSDLVSAADKAAMAPTATPDGGATFSFDDGPPEFRFGGPFAIDGVTMSASFAPVPIELVYDDGGQRRVKRVNVIGVLNDGDMLNGEAMQGNIRILDSLQGQTVSRNTHYLTEVAGADVRAVAREVERAFLGSGINATVMADGFAQTQALTRNILRLLQGFMALGLLVGIAGLGVITTRTVVERRQQVGMLRALGYQARMVGLSFVLEASFIAITGILIGAATGIVLGLNIIGVAFGSVADFQMPWGSIAFVVLLAYGFALLTTIIPAWQASRIYPAEALRYE